MPKESNINGKEMSFINLSKACKVPDPKWRPTETSIRKSFKKQILLWKKCFFFLMVKVVMSLLVYIIANIQERVVNTKWATRKRTRYLDFPVTQMVKNHVKWETGVRSLGQDLLDRGTSSHSSILAWRIPWAEELGGLRSMGSQRVRHGWATDTFAVTTQLTSTSWFQNSRRMPVVWFWETAFPQTLLDTVEMSCSLFTCQYKPQYS